MNVVKHIVHLQFGALDYTQLYAVGAWDGHILSVPALMQQQYQFLDESCYRGVSGIVENTKVVYGTFSLAAPVACTKRLGQLG